MKTSYELKQQARQALKQTYWMVFIVLILVSVVLSAISTTGIGFLLLGPVSVGYSLYLINVFSQTNRGDDLNDLLIGFKINPLQHVITYIIMSIYIFLWSLLLLIPGIMKAFAYSQVGYILAEDPNLTYKEALKASEEMMHGHKSRYFGLLLSFIGWYLVGILTFGIGLIFVMPYIEMTRAAFYLDLKGQA